MTHYVFFLLLLCALLFSLTRLCFLCWPHQNLAKLATAKCTRRERRLKPRSPDDCPACRLASPASSGAIPASASVQPWGEVKSRRGAPKHIPTEGFACPNYQCTYYGKTDAHTHALVGDGKHGQAERIQTFRCKACRTTFSARRDTPLYRLKTASQQVAIVLSALAEGLDASAAERVFGYRQATITRWLTRAGRHAESLHERSFRDLHLPHLQLDELRTRLRSATQVLWLWVALDPLTKVVPVLQLGPRTQHMAHRLIHALRQSLVRGCLPLFSSDGLNLYFYALLGPFWKLDPGGSSRQEHASMAGGSRPDLRSGEKMLTFGASSSKSGTSCV
jgi:transposase-like protein